MKKFKLMLYRSSEEIPASNIEVIEGDSLIEICSKFPLLIAQISERIMKEELAKVIDDDIPF